MIIIRRKKYGQIGVHMIFYIKIDGNFTRKARLISDGHKTDLPTTNNFQLLSQGTLSALLSFMHLKKV